MTVSIGFDLSTNRQNDNAKSSFIFIDILLEKRSELEQIRTKNALFGKAYGLQTMQAPL